MSDFEMEHDEFDAQLDAMLDQLGPDPLPAGFTARTMAAVRLQGSGAQLEPQPIHALAAEPFSLHWSDFVPAFAAAVFGAIVLFIWVGGPAAYAFFDGVQTSTLFNSANDLQLAALFSVLGLLVAAVPFLLGNSRSRSLFLLTMSAV